MEHFVAIKDVCSWPNLQRLQDGTLIAAIFNQPCHGLWEGDLDCWASEDEGKTWQFRSRIAEHEPGTNRMNCAVGVLDNHDIIVACSGWDGRKPAREMTNFTASNTLPVIAYRSADNGKKWSAISTLPPYGQGRLFIPFGNIVRAADGSLCMPAYAKTTSDSPSVSCLLRSFDGGIT